MCGIVGYIGGSQAKDILIRGLKRLEYRGYDSAGVAVKDNDDISLVKRKGRIDDLPKDQIPESTTGIGHTRWATHGKPSDKNAHPFSDCTGNISIIHNGIIDNFVSLKEDLIKRGHDFTSDTDSEVIAHLMEENYEDDMVDALKKTVKDLEGSYAVVVIHSGKNEILAARNQSPLVVGVGDRENLIASDVPALLDHTEDVKYLQDHDIVRLTENSIDIWDGDGCEVERETKTVEWTIEDAEKGGYEHYMMKEIHEQPKAIHDSILGRLQGFEGLDLKKYRIDSIRLIACGTSYHAALVGKYIIEEISSIPCMVEMASEYRYSSRLSEYPFTILLSQSGETADTLAAAREASHRGCKTLGITNVLDSSITREVDEVIYTQAGPEIGVAATKTFTTQLVVLYLLALELGLMKRTLDVDKAETYRDELRRLPRLVDKVLDKSEGIKNLSKKLAQAEDIFFVGRNINYPVALEGALKLKEIAYIHAAGYPAGELKHGPFALLTEDSPVIAICIKDDTFQKMLGNIGEIAARGSPLFGVTERDKEVEKLCDHLVYIPEVLPLFSPIVVNVVLQLFAYYTAHELGRDIDKPRNLAKSVTVE
ncbi:MAG: glutamine--fructose-6-phosphate transaminase (isomerizing) [Candidatus Saliniplasma sp.]